MTEKEYIEREAAQKVLADDYAYNAAKLLDTVPVADVQEIKHAKWIEYKYKLKCSNCNTLIDIDDIPEKICLNYCSILNYCPYCGAKMEADND